MSTPEIAWALQSAEALTGINKETVYPLLRIELRKKAAFALEARAVEAERICPTCKGYRHVCSATLRPWNECDCGHCERGPVTRVTCPTCDQRAAKLRRIAQEVRDAT